MKKFRKMISITLTLVMCLSLVVPTFAVNDSSEAESAATVEPRVIRYDWMCTASGVNVYRIVNGSPDYNDPIGLMFKNDVFTTYKGGTTNGMLYGYPTGGELAQTSSTVYSATSAQFYTFGGTSIE